MENVKHGENHPKAKLTDHEVELLRNCRASGMGWKKLARKFDISSRSARDICNFKRR